MVLRLTQNIIFLGLNVSGVLDINLVFILVLLPKSYY